MSDGTWWVWAFYTVVAWALALKFATNWLEEGINEWAFERLPQF